MAKYSLKEVEQVNGKIKYFKLEIDGRCQFDEFCQDIQRDGNLTSELASIYSIMNSQANLHMLPKTKFRDITPKKSKNKEYEFKKGSVRIYALKDAVGNIIVYAGKKGSQSIDMARFRTIKLDYLNSIK
ncbi:hypothetical protein FHW88_000276 [Mucilaginibacter sp. SG538B]|uniref:hypothetical protein n=1 Tax=Mucilaginibacter sp. SG538B TaxID=2587021 RepID=UPI00159DD29D|nr:hypothetical protein [Mucilaginibacter sp. SG538B]NVM62000.1 hypothetical protein [Mucilaginibacter sp. SG538B]